MTIGSLFSGIGGLELGLEMAGWGPPVFQVEIDPFCRDILAQHFPKADRSQTNVETAVRLPRVGLLCGGFPCQNVSSAGKGEGLKGSQSGLWTHFRRIAEELHPGLVVVENVASGGRRWLPFVRRDLHLLGYRSRAVGISAFDCGAPHLRRRVFVLAADPECFELRDESRWSGRPRGHRAALASDDGASWTSADAGGQRQREPNAVETAQSRKRIAREDAGRGDQRHGARWTATDADGEGQLQPEGRKPPSWRWARDGHEGGWTPQSDLGRDLDGFSRWLDAQEVTYADATQVRSTEVLLALREVLEAEVLQRSAGRSNTVSPTAILLAYVRKLEGEGWHIGAALEGKKAAAKGVRSMRQHQASARPSRGRQRGGESSGEYSDALRVLSRFLAPYAEAAWAAYLWPNAPSLCGGVSPVAFDIPDRMDREKALGNAVVPYCGYVAGRFLKHIVRERSAYATAAE